MTGPRSMTRVVGSSDCPEAQLLADDAHRLSEQVAQALRQGLYRPLEALEPQHERIELRHVDDSLPDLMVDFRMQASKSNVDMVALPMMLAKALQPERLTRESLHVQRDEALRIMLDLHARAMLGKQTQAWFWKARLFAPTPWSTTMFNVLAISPREIERIDPSACNSTASTLADCCEVVVLKDRDVADRPRMWIIQPVVYDFNRIAIETAQHWLHASKAGDDGSSALADSAWRTIDHMEMKLDPHPISPVMPTVVHSLVYGLRNAHDDHLRTIGKGEITTLIERASCMLPQIQKNADMWLSWRDREIAA